MSESQLKFEEILEIMMSKKNNEENEAKRKIEEKDEIKNRELNEENVSLKAILL